ncbi:hypothetical protein N7491_007964, partial [Penicillium cf. griseofulvum]
ICFFLSAIKTPSSAQSGLTPPLTVNTELNHNGVITFIASVSLFLILGSLVIRVYSARSRKSRQLDDLTFAATILALGQISAVFVQIHFGSRRSKVLIADEDLHSNEKPLLLGKVQRRYTLRFSIILTKSIKGACLLYHYST